MDASQFIKVPPMHIIPGKRGWRLDGPMIYYSKHLRKRIIISKGFETDLASVPKVVPNIVINVANGPSRLPAVVHDWLCYTAIQDMYGIKQKDADRVFREALEIQGVHWFKRNAILWFPTRLFQFFTSPFKKKGHPPIHIGD